VAPGSYPLTITGTSGTTTHTAQVTLVVANPAPAADFALAVTPATATVNRGQTTSYSVTVTRNSSFTGTVSLSATGLPSRASASFQPEPHDGLVHDDDLDEQEDRGRTYTVTITGPAEGYRTRRPCS